MAFAKVFGLSVTDIDSNADSDVSTVAGARYALPVQIVRVESDLSTTLELDAHANHRRVELQLGDSNIITNGEPCIRWDNSLGYDLIVTGSGLLTAGGSVTTTGTANAASQTNFTGVTGLTMARTTNTIARSLSTTTWTSPGTNIGYFSNDTGNGNMDAVGMTILSTTSLAQVQYNTGTVTAKGPAFQNGDTGFGLSATAANALTTTLTAGTRTVGVLPSNGASLVASGTGRVDATPASTTYTFTATNNSGNSLTVNGTTIANGDSEVISSAQSGSTLACTVVRPSTTTYTATANSASASNVGGLTGLTVARTSTTTSAYTGALGTNTGRAYRQSVQTNQPPLTYTVTAADSIITASAGRGNDDSAVRLTGTAGSHTINLDSGGVGTSVAVSYRGPAFQTGDDSGITTSGTLSASDVVSLTRSQGTETQGVNISSRRRASVSTTTYTFTATNGTGHTITVNGTSIANGSSATISSNQSGSTLAITAVAPAVNSDGNPLAPASKSIVGTGVTSATDGAVTDGVDLTGFTGQYSRTS